MDLIGRNAAISALIVTVLGYSAQILELWKNKNSIRGISITMFSLILYMSVSWLVYGIKEKNWNIILPNIPGVLLSSIIVLIIWWYK